MTFQPLDNLDGKVVVITGMMGGIGFAVAQRLAASGARIVGIVRRDIEKAQKAADTLANPHLNHMVVCADLLDEDQLKSAYLEIKKLEKIDVLVNTVGKTFRLPPTDLHLITDDFFDKALQNNLRTYYSAIRTFAPLLRNTPESVIVNIGSTAGYRGGGSNIAYSTAKAGIDCLTRTLAVSMAPVRVMSVNPGALMTNFIPNRDPNYFEMVVSTTPLRRVTTVMDVASAVEGCITLLRFCTGQVIAVDGGKNI